LAFLRTAITVLLLAVFLGVSRGADNPRPNGKNCALAVPPLTAGEEFNDGAVLRIFPRAKDIDASYTGYQVLFAEYESKWVVTWEQPLCAYTFKDGNIWPLVLGIVFVAPRLAGHLRHSVRASG
jgi:hypothetical protein